MSGLVSISLRSEDLEKLFKILLDYKTFFLLIIKISQLPIIKERGYGKVN